MARIAAVILLLFLFSCAAEPDIPLLKHIHHRSFVYYGDDVKYKKPAVITAIEVFNRIPFYKRIINENLNHPDPEYYFLLQKSCSKFYGAIDHLVKQKNLDLIVEKGKRELTIPAEDVTKEAIIFIESN